MYKNTPENIKGFWTAIICYMVWGTVPIYWKQLKHISAFELIAHRILWSAVFSFILIYFLNDIKKLKETFKKSAPVLVLTTLLISTNWLTFVWAVNENRILEASLGYYANPILNVLFGAFLLKEKLSKLQIVSSFIAAFGVLYLFATAGVFPWVSLVIAISFALYGLIRKIAPVDPLAGLTLESAMLVPFALLYAFYLEDHHAGHFTHGLFDTLMLMGGGIVTLAPLLLFLYSIKRIPLSTMGFLQFITPTTTFCLAVFYYNEPFDHRKLVTFGCVWLAVFLYLSDLKLKHIKQVK